MQISQIHDDLAKLSGPNPAGYIETQSFAYVTLDRLKSNAILLKNKVLVAGSGKLSAVLKDDHWSSKPEISLMNRRQMNSQGTIPRNPLFQDREVDVGITATLDLTVEIFIPPKPGEAETAGYKPAVISTVTISISNARSHLRAENNILIFEGADFDIQRKIQRLPGADDLLQAAGIDLLEAAYVEGHIGYGVVSQAVASALGQRSEISLATIFPSINFGKDINLHILVNGNALGIIPTEKVTLAAGAHCVCNEGPDFEIKQATIVQISSPPKTPEELVNSNIGNVSLGGPLPENKDPRRDFGSRYEGTGMAGLYIPQDFAQALTVDVMPSIKITASDNGTIGYRTEASVGFKNFRVSFDVSGGGILLDIDLDISVSAYCDMELFKGLRVPIGWAVIMPAQGSRASLQIGFYPSVDRSGTVRLKSTLKKADMGSYVAVVIGIGTALKILGVTAWIGFLVDVVLATILSIGFPILLKKEIGKYMGNKEWALIDGVPITNPTVKNFDPSAPYDVSTSSLLASFGLKRG